MKDVLKRIPFSKTLQTLFLMKSPHSNFDFEIQQCCSCNNFNKLLFKIKDCVLRIFLTSIQQNLIIRFPRKYFLICNTILNGRSILGEIKNVWEIKHLVMASCIKRSLVNFGSYRGPGKESSNILSTNHNIQVFRDNIDLQHSKWDFEI